MKIEPRYLGDGVYAQLHTADPTALVLTTAAHEADPHHDQRIVLEYDVILHLEEFIRQWRENA